MRIVNWHESMSYVASWELRASPAYRFNIRGKLSVLLTQPTASLAQLKTLWPCRLLPSQSVLAALWSSVPDNLLLGFGLPAYYDFDWFANQREQLNYGDTSQAARRRRAPAFLPIAGARSSGFGPVIGRVA